MIQKYALLEPFLDGYLEFIILLLKKIFEDILMTHYDLGSKIVDYRGKTCLWKKYNEKKYIIIINSFIEDQQISVSFLNF